MFVDERAWSVSTARARMRYDGGIAVCKTVRRINACLAEDWLHQRAADDQSSRGLLSFANGPCRY
jgi:hypothetical protein